MEFTDFFMVETELYGSTEGSRAYVSESLSTYEEVKRKWEQNKMCSFSDSEQEIIQFPLSLSISSHLLDSSTAEIARKQHVLDAGEKVIFLLRCSPIESVRVAESGRKWLVSNDPASVIHRREAFKMLKEIELHLDDQDQKPPVSLVENIKFLLKRLYSKINLPVDVEGTAEGDILVTVFNKKFDALMMYCNASGTVLCMSNLPGKQEGEKYDSIDSVPDSEFVLDTLNVLCSNAD